MSNVQDQLREYADKVEEYTTRTESTIQTLTKERDDLLVENGQLEKELEELRDKHSEDAAESLEEIGKLLREASGRLDDAINKPIGGQTGGEEEGLSGQESRQEEE